jgi:hypothetical protein
MNPAFDQRRCAWRLAVVPPVLISLLLVQFEPGVERALENMRMVVGLLPYPSVVLKHSFDFWKAVPIVCAIVLLVSLVIPRVACAEAAVLGYGMLMLACSWQLYWTCILISAFMR